MCLAPGGYVPTFVQISELDALGFLDCFEWHLDPSSGRAPACGVPSDDLFAMDRTRAQRDD
jgi:hypothetical protein